MNYLVIGGSKSGKSEISERIALNLNTNRVIYIATMKPYDDEDEDRIKKHIKNREGYNFITYEIQKDINSIINFMEDKETVLIDSMTSLLTNEMFVGKNIIKSPSKKIVKNLKEIIKRCENTIIVSDYIFNDSINYDSITENFKKELATVNKEMAIICENVIECSYGSYKYVKGRRNIL